MWVLFVGYLFSRQFQEELFFGREHYLGKPFKALQVLIQVDSFLQEQLSLFSIFTQLFYYFHILWYTSRYQRVKTAHHEV